MALNPFSNRRIINRSIKNNGKINRRFIGVINSSGSGGGGGSATFIDYRSASDPADGDSLSTTAMAIPSQSFVIVYAAGLGASDHPPQSVDIGGQALTKLFDTNDGEANRYWLSCWYLSNASADPSAITTVNYSSIDNATYRNVYVAVYTGISLTDPNDGFSNVNVGTDLNLATSSTNRTAQNITTTNANDLLLGYFLNYNNSLTATAADGWTIRGGSGAQPSNFSEKIVSNIGVYPNGNYATVNSADTYMAIFTAWKLA